MLVRFRALKAGAHFLPILMLLLVSARAAADYSRDRAARAKIDEALERYLRTEFEAAESLLTGTIRACEERCRPQTIARAWMYVGVVHGSGLNEQEAARDAFDHALDSDAQVELDTELATDETQTTWRRAHDERSTAATKRAEQSASPKPVARVAPDETEQPDICPPGFPGCVAEHGRCQADKECKAGLACTTKRPGTHQTCERPLSCSDDEECADGTCLNHTCTTGPSPAPVRNNWFGLYGAFDLAHLPNTADSCAGVYHCYVDGQALDASSAVTTGGVRGGFARGPTRVLAGFEHRLSALFFVAGRAGLAFGGAPNGFLPLHAELRFGTRFSGPSWLSPHAHVSGGVAEIDARLPVLVDDGHATHAADAYAAFGRTFVGLGGGATLLASNAFGVDLDVSGVWLFPDQTWAIEPSLGIVTGF